MTCIEASTSANFSERLVNGQLTRAALRASLARPDGNCKTTPPGISDGVGHRTLHPHAVKRVVKINDDGELTLLENVRNKLISVFDT